MKVSTNMITVLCVMLVYCTVCICTEPRALQRFWRDAVINTLMVEAITA